MLIVPNSWDQPDNGERALRLGIARTISKRHFTPERAAVEVRQLLQEPAYQRRASEVQQQIQSENGSKTACDAVEKLLESAQR
jgi:rhamnosyltransferase subunit B